MSIVNFISNKIKRRKYNQEWRKLNQNNNTSLSGLKRMERITVGNWQFLFNSTKCYFFIGWGT